MKKTTAETRQDDPLFSRLREKPDIQTFAAEVIDHPEWIPQLIDIMRTDRSSVKYLGDKVIRQMAADRPDLVLPFFDEIAALIDHSNSFMRWGAIQTLGLLVPQDQENRFGRHYEHFFDLINDPSMITAGNVIGQTGAIVLARPLDEPDITRRLLQVRDNTYWHKEQPSPECKNIVCGMVIDCFDQFFDRSSRKEEVLAFVASLKDNPRKAVAKKAELFLKKHADGP